jgi:phage I-like protein
MTTRQRKAVNELIRALVAEDPAAAGVDFCRLLAARERLNVALEDAGEHGGLERLSEAAREALARIDEVTDARFAAAGEDPADAQSLADFATLTSTDEPAHAGG